MVAADGWPGGDIVRRTRMIDPDRRAGRTMMPVEAGRPRALVWEIGPDLDAPGSAPDLRPDREDPGRPGTMAQ